MTADHDLIARHAIFAATFHWADLDIKPRFRGSVGSHS